MHKINFCTSLCLPKGLEGYEARGINAVYEFDNAFVIPMGGIATPLHVLYSSRPSLEGKILQFGDLDSKDKLDAIADRAIAGDCALDPDERYDHILGGRDDNLKYVAKRLLEQGHEKVVIWSNNGIGDDATESLDGILRDDDGLAYAVKVKGEVDYKHAKGLPNSYQNSAHDHIHIAPDTTGFADVLIAELEKIHKDPVRNESFEEYRNLARQKPDYLPCISVCVVDKDTDWSKPLVHTFYQGANSSFPEGANTAGFVRKTVLGVSKSKGLDFSDKDVSKKYLAETAEIYSRILK